MKQLQKVIYCLDTEGFTFKPKTETAAISSRIANNPKASTIEELAKYHVTEGRTITAATFKKKDGVLARRDENWHAQQLFLLDFDGSLTVQEALSRCKKFEIEPSLIYATFSSEKSNNRFRMVFCLSEPTYDIKKDILFKNHFRPSSLNVIRQRQQLPICISAGKE